MTSGTSGIRLTDLELLSAYLDDELSPREHAALEARLAAEPALQAELDGLRRTVQILRATPPLTPPRNFTLDPAVYRRRPPWWLRYGAFRLVGILGTAAALVFIVFGVLFMSNSGSRPVPQSIAYQATQAGLIARDTTAAPVSEGETEPSNARPSAAPLVALAPTVTSAASDAVLVQRSPTPLATATARLEHTAPPPSPSPVEQDKGSETGEAALSLPPAPTAALALGGAATITVERLGSAADRATEDKRSADETRTANAPAPSGGDGAGYNMMMTPTAAALTLEQPAQGTAASKSSVGVAPMVAGTAAPSVLSATLSATPSALPSATITATVTATQTAAPTQVSLERTATRPAPRPTGTPVPSATPLQVNTANAPATRTATPGATPSLPVSETPAAQQSPDSLGPGARLLLVGGLALLIISLLVFGIAWARSRL